MFEELIKWYPDLLFIVKGMLVNIQFTFVSIFFGLLIGFFLAIAKLSKFSVIRYLSQTYTSIFRGTPLLLQLTIIYYLLPSALDMQIPVFTAAVIAFSLNSAAYTSEILRSGINSIEIGQIEASRALGVPEYITTRDIVFPQAIRKILPSLVNEFINLLKETSLVSILGVSEVLRNATSVASQKLDYTVPMLTAAATYYIVVFVIVTFANKLEKALEL